MGALAVSPGRKHIALYIRLRGRNLTGLDTRDFLQQMLLHIRGPLVLLWDRGSIHRRKEVKQFILEHPRLHVEYFPGYAPELNPAEYVWNQTDRALANSVSEDLHELGGMLRGSVRRLRHSQKLLWSCIHASELPWTR